MLTKDLILSYSRGDKIFPKYIRRDSVALQPIEEALTAINDLVDASRKDIEYALQTVFSKYFTPKITQGFIGTILSACTFADGIKQDVIALRDTLFTKSADIWKEEDPKNIPTADRLHPFFSRRFGLPNDMSREALEEHLYSDLRKHRRLLTPPDIAAEDILNRYNTSQVQGVLLYANSATLVLKNANNLILREFLFRLRFLGLIFYISDKRKTGRTTVQIDGPISLSESVRAYGHAFSGILPEIFKLKQTQWELTVEIREKTAEKQKKLRIDSDSGYFSFSKDTGVWFKQELTDFISRWNSQYDDVTADVCNEFFTDYSTVCRIPDVVFTTRDTDEKTYMEWIRYIPKEFVSRVNQSLPIIPAKYIFLLKGSKKKEIALARQTDAHLLAFRSVIPMQVIKTVLKDMPTRA